MYADIQHIDPNFEQKPNFLVTKPTVLLLFFIYAISIFESFFKPEMYPCILQYRYPNRSNGTNISWY